MRRRTGLITGGVAVVVAIAGTIVGVTLTRPDEVAVVPVSTASAAAAESSCGLPGSNGTNGATAVSWENVAGWSLPISATDGPGLRDKRGPWSCFARTESGAVVAGYVIAMRAGGLADDWKTVVRQQTMPGPGQDILLGSVPNFSSVTTPRGFKVAAYSPDRSTVRYRLGVNGGDYSCTIDVQWSNNDWRLVLGEDGSTSSGCVKGIPDEFTPWGP